MALQFAIVITTPRKTFFSHVKPMSPKMYTAMKELAIKYSQMFKEEFKVSRVIPTKNGGWSSDD